MRINDKIKKTVAFLQYQMNDGTFMYAGTCFFVLGKEKESKINMPYVVTAKHVLEKTSQKGLDKIFVKLNLIDKGSSTFETNISDWLSHEDESVDISIFALPFDPNKIDQFVVLESTFMTEEVLKQQEVDCGDEVIITGLFRYHSGLEKNLPIVRIGNIAMMPGEKIKTEDKFRDAYLIESRSIGGLSGSPVFINYGLHRRLKGKVLVDSGVEVVNSLIGVIYGHFDTKSTEIDINEDSIYEEKKINVGIAIVTPVSKLIDMFQSDYFIDYDSKMRLSYKL